MPRPPTQSDIPSSLTVTIIQPPQDPVSSRHPVNILLLLHGIGDTQVGFATFGQALNLANTHVLAIRGPSVLPAIFGPEKPLSGGGGAFHWGADILFDPDTGALDADAGFARSTGLVRDTLIRDVLVAKCGYPPRNVFLFGFGQGGMVALDVAATWCPPTVAGTSGPPSAGWELGGVIAIGAKVPSMTTVPAVKSPTIVEKKKNANTDTSPSSSQAQPRKSPTPILLLASQRSREVTRPAIARARTLFTDLEYVRWDKTVDSMPTNRQEVLPIMRFLASRLGSRFGVPEGAVEI